VTCKAYCRLHFEAYHLPNAHPPLGTYRGDNSSVSADEASKFAVVDIITPSTDEE